jgi:hypothetical protein
VRVFGTLFKHRRIFGTLFPKKRFWHIFSNIAVFLARFFLKSVFWRAFF